MPEDQDILKLKNNLEKYWQIEKLWLWGEFFYLGRSSVIRDVSYPLNEQNKLQAVPANPRHEQGCAALPSLPSNLRLSTHAAQPVAPPALVPGEPAGSGTCPARNQQCLWLEQLPRPHTALTQPLHSPYMVPAAPGGEAGARFAGSPMHSCRCGWAGPWHWGFQCRLCRELRQRPGNKNIPLKLSCCPGIFEVGLCCSLFVLAEGVKKKSW